MVKIGFLYHGNPTDVKYWSGTVSALHKAISSSDKVEVRDIVVTPHKLSSLVRKLVRVTSLKKNNLSFVLSSLDAAKANRMIKESGCDVLFAPACSKLIYSGRKALKGKKLIYLSDATYHRMQGYYYTHSSHDQKIGNAWESNAQTLASKIIYPAKWSYDDAIEYYNVPEEKLNVFKLGANMDDYGYKTVKSGLKTYKLLLVGVDYVRKGVDVAIEAVKLLNETSEGVKYELSVVGLNKPDFDIPEYVTFYGRLRKNNKEELKRLVDCYAGHDIFIMPTKAECAGIVFAEAAMFGLPSFTYATGGTPDYVEDGVTGRCLDIKSGPKEFCEAIKQAVESGRIEDFSIAARKKYENELNWNSWREKFDVLIDDLL